MSEIEPRKRPKHEVAPRHIPNEIVPVPFDEAPGLVRAALKGTSLVDPIASAYAGWLFFEPHLRFTPVDETHTRIEIDVVETVHGAVMLMFNQRRAAIDRFFVAIQDELDRRERWRPPPPVVGDAEIESAD